MPDAFVIGPLLIPGRPAIVVLCLLFAVWAAGRVAQRAGLDGPRARRVAEGAAWAGLLGARLGYVATNWSAFRAQPWTGPGHGIFHEAGRGSDRSPANRLESA